eukprot:COSAG01_NODE_1261_length_11001_cov_11.811961_7_plen_125_part_00
MRYTHELRGRPTPPSRGELRILLCTRVCQCGLPDDCRFHNTLLLRMARRAGVTGVVPSEVEVRVAARQPDLLAAATVRRLCSASSASSSLASSPAAAAAAKRPQPWPVALYRPARGGEHGRAAA